ncbi:MAG: type II toxin-antitoxin system prevent-host-death family antitoxin [Planctomycetes bacterium]|nr:type II toxin-antitoxin system prevent-host-death family antitoxin [Planctomycetota bacterium]
MDTVPIHEAKSTLSQLVKRAAGGEIILIGENGKPEAVLTSVIKLKPRKRIGLLAGKLSVPDDFDAPLPDDVLQGFMGGK